MSTFDQWAAPASQQNATASLYDSGGFDDEPPPPSENMRPQGSSFIQKSARSRGPVIETKNSHLLALTSPAPWQSDEGTLWRPLTQFCAGLPRTQLFLVLGVPFVGSGLLQVCVSRVQRFSCSSPAVLQSSHQSACCLSPCFL
jgi:hypothetical protein